MAEAADLLGAAAHVALHHLPLPAELVEPFADRLVAAARNAVLRVHADPLPDGVEALVELGCRDGGQPVFAGPLVAHLVGCTERERVVDERGAAQPLCGQQPDAPVDAGHAASVLVEAVEARQLGAVEVLFGEVAPRLDDEHVEPCLGEDGRRGAAAGAGPHHDDVAVEREVARDGERLDGRRRRVLGRAERPRIADRVPDRIAVAVGAALAVVGEQRALAKRLERGAPLGHAAVGPREEHLLALGLRQGGEALDPAAGDRAEQMGVPQAEQLSHLLALGSARVARHERKQRLRHAELGRRRKTVAARSERVADGVEGGAGLGRECGGAHAPTLCDGGARVKGARPSPRRVPNRHAARSRD